MRLPLRITRFIGIMDEVSAYIVRDAAGRSIQVCCDVNPLRREVAKLWSPEEAEALAKRIARFLTDEAEAAANEAAIDVMVAENARGLDRKR